ncbi:hypothetical protein CO655_05650 [Rhizobium sp. M1]|nr:hypothetical protein CO655_05650 [Rhizobium sp. M1]PDT32878.1 hypothetical protein CO671_27560 [Rhizobium sp. M10]
MESSLATACSLIPVLGLDPRDVTGIQPRRVCAVNDPFPVEESSAPKDLGALDSCDEHRNEGERGHSLRYSMHQRREQFG